MDLSELIPVKNPNAATLANVKRSRAWPIIRAINNGYSTIPDLGIALSMNDNEVIKLIDQAGPIIKNERITKWYVGGGRKRFFIAPEFAEEISRLSMRRKVSKPEPVNVDRGPAEPTDDEFLKLPLVLLLNKKNRIGVRHLVIDIMIILEDATKRLHCGEIADRLKPTLNGNNRQLLPALMKILKKNGLVFNKPTGYIVNPIYRHIGSIAARETKK